MKRVLLLSSLVALVACSQVPQGAWVPAGDHIMTPWAEEVSPANAHPEYPRPQMVRARWQSLNGLWDYAVTPKDARAHAMDGAYRIYQVRVDFISYRNEAIQKKDHLTVDRQILTVKVSDKHEITNIEMEECDSIVRYYTVK